LKRNYFVLAATHFPWHFTGTGSVAQHGSYFYLCCFCVVWSVPSNQNNYMVLMGRRTRRAKNKTIVEFYNLSGSWESNREG